MTNPARHIPDDWYPLPLPANMETAENVYLDSSYSFALFHSQQPAGLTFGNASGAYDRAGLIVGPNGKVTVGEFTVLNGTYIICDDRVTIGAHCLLSWGVVITDNWNPGSSSVESRRAAMQAASSDALRHPPSVGTPQPVVLEDNVWVGFDSIILPGVKLGRGCVVGCRSIVAEDVPPYAVVVGQPARILRYLDADDTDEVRTIALHELVKRD